ncbi:MAG: protein kinase [Gallionella sp.]
MATPKKIGKYEVRGILGTGGMGVVYRGWDPAIARAVAIKSVSKSLPQVGNELDSALNRFRQEAQVVGRLVHPRIVQIYDYIEDEAGAYIVMELVSGKTLKQHIDQKTQYGIADVGLIIRQILDGIGYAHEFGVVHRDIKPSNILISEEGRVKINDFGIAHIESSDLTQVGDLLGTPHYMSPEQCLGSEVDSLADLFSIGVIAYELLTGRKPFAGNFATVMNLVINSQPAKPSQVNPKLSAYMDEVLLKALAKKPENRFQSAKEFSEAFKVAIESSLLSSNDDGGFPPDSSTMLLNASRHLADANARQSIDSGPTLNETAGSQINLNTGVRKARMLVVDDEERILAALKSLFRHRYHVFCTTDGYKALDFLTRYHMHVVISDQRMPAMLGVELLRQSREISPRSVRILLTGYSDLAAIVGSINDGEIYRFISKPWDNKSLKTIVAEAATIGLELANTKTPQVELPATMAAGVLVIEADEDLTRLTRELTGKLCQVVTAPDPESALQIMQSREIAVVIADVAPGQDKLIAMLKLLKQMHPLILTIVTIKLADADLVIDLINQAQVFRILNKPINVGMLKTHLHDALQRYLTYKQTPDLLQEHKVEHIGNESEQVAGKGILDRVKALRSRWFGK